MTLISKRWNADSSPKNNLMCCFERDFVDWPLDWPTPKTLTNQVIIIFFLNKKKYMCFLNPYTSLSLIFRIKYFVKIKKFCFFFLFLNLEKKNF